MTLLPSFLRSSRLILRSSSKALRAPLCRLVHTTIPSLKSSEAVSHDGPKFPGAINSKYTERLNLLTNYPVIPTFRVLDKDGKVLNKEYEYKECTQPWATKIYKDMITLNIMDMILYEAQRQGRISFYMTSYGEEATHMGSAAALGEGDVIFGQYRESGVLLHLGFTLEEFMNQCYSNEEDYGKGRQMPVHYGSARLNFHTISSPLGTQIPQAAGAAYGLKREGKDNIVICYFGDGAASEGDFHAALNMASTTGAPCVFFCRNNGFAISTPALEQYRGDGIASRGVGYGIDTIRVDGNDVMAVYAATKMAREIAIKQKKPVLIEALTYRIGHHSTSDDSSAYRSKKEVEDWRSKDNPSVRFRKYLESKSWWSQADEDSFRKDIRRQILTAFADAEKKKKPSIKELFTDVYDTVPPHLKEQEKELWEIVEKYPEYYPTDQFKK
ncbi:thiamine diphosphate-binding protein [Paraphysoderma sedebokerense]|nr:thiamine diphosphate-binding protein [Paraphysoderma sedebokerense]